MIHHTCANKLIHNLHLDSDLSDKAEILLRSFSFSITVPAEGYAYVDVTITIPDGYALGAFSVYGGYVRNAVSLNAILVSDTIIAVEGRSNHTEALTISGNINALFYN